MSHYKPKFIEWYNKFITSFKGVRVNDNWFDKCEESHKSIREWLGGNDSVTKKIEVDKPKTDTLDAKSVSEFAIGIYRLIPDYFRAYGLDYYCFIHKTAIGTSYAKMSWGKHVSFWMESTKTSEEIKIAVNNLLSKIGKLWSLEKDTKDTIYCTIDTSAVSFVFIGHYGVDNNSCFKQTSLNQVHKYMIGQTKNTFIITLTRSKHETVHDAIVNGAVFARVWGVTNEDHSIINILNAYPPIEKLDKVTFPAIQEFCKQLLNADSIECKENRLIVRGVYQNRNSARSYYDPSKTKFESQYISINTKELDIYRECFACRLPTTKPESIDLLPYCPGCAEKRRGSMCEWSGRYTNTTLLDAYDRNGNPIKIAGFTKSEEFRTCQGTGKFYHMDDMVEDVSGKQYNIFYIREINAKLCPVHNAYMIDASGAALSSCIKCDKEATMASI
jgi:hypothetical protein